MPLQRGWLLVGYMRNMQLLVAEKLRSAPARAGLQKGPTVCQGCETVRSPALSVEKNANQDTPVSYFRNSQQEGRERPESVA